jgi:hypothetical protein
MPPETELFGSNTGLADLTRTFGERLVTEEHDGYEASRAVWNGLIDRRPGAIVYAHNVDEIKIAVNFAREKNLTVAVRGQGHHVAGYGVCDEGVVVDLSLMKKMEIDEAQRTVRVGPGLTVGEFLDAIEARGLIMTVGSHSSVGMTGLTLGGGIGILMSRYGLASDNLLEVDVVTADGEVHTASAGQNSNLFWAVRGGGGNFGIVTSLKFGLHPVEPMLAGVLVHPVPRIREVLGIYREHAETAPANLGLFAACVTGPGGRPCANIIACHTGDLKEGERLLAPIREFGPPVADLIRPMPYSGMLHALDGQEPAGHRYAYTCRGIENLTDEILDIVSEFALRRTSLGTAILLYRQHGAVTEKTEDATAYSGRHLPYLLGIYMGWGDENDAGHLTWLKEFETALLPLTCSSGCVSLLSDASSDVVRESYGDNYARLQSIKTAWDPGNLFCHNHNVRPKD